MAHRELQRTVITIPHRVKEPFKGVVKPSVFPAGLRVDKTAAHHRRQRQRDEARNQHRDHNRHGKLMQEAAEQSAQEQHGNKNRRQRQRHGDDRKTDFLGTVKRGLHWRFANFHVAHDVFEHDDGIVHHEADAQGQRHQREIIKAVTQQRHRPKRADDGHGERQTGNDCGRNIPQKNEDDHHDQRDGQ